MTKYGFPRHSRREEYFVSQCTRSIAGVVLVAAMFTISACGDGSPKPSTYLSRTHSESSQAFSQKDTPLLAEGWHSIKLESASDHPTAFGVSDPNTSCMVEAEIIQVTDADGNKILTGNRAFLRTTGFHYVVRFKWSRAASGGLGDYLTGSTTLYGSDWGPVRIYLPETAEYLFQARGGSGRTGTLERCRFNVSLSRDRSRR
jgi:hypothetical protein